MVGKLFFCDILKRIMDPGLSAIYYHPHARRRAASESRSPDSRHVIELNWPQKDSSRSSFSQKGAFEGFQFRGEPQRLPSKTIRQR